MKSAAYAKIFFRGAVFAACVAAFYGVSIFHAPERAHAAPCHMLTVASPVPMGFGLPYNPLSFSYEPLITMDCQDTEVEVVIGTGEAHQAIFKTGYIWQGGRWRPIDLRESDDMGNWVRGQARTALPPPEGEGPGFFIAFMCHHLGENAWIEWKCGCRHYYCDQPMWQLQAYDHDASPPAPQYADPGRTTFFARAGEVRPDGSMILLDGYVRHTVNFWTRELPPNVPSDFTSPIDYVNGKMHVRLEVFSMGGDTPAHFQICFENGTHGKSDWGETCHMPLSENRITGPGVYTWSDRTPAAWWKHQRGFNWEGGKQKRITINYRSGKSFLDHSLPYDAHLTIIFTPKGRTFAGFE